MATTAPLLWLDGKIMPARDAAVPLMGHAHQRGSLVFDVGSFHRTPRGPALFRGPEHVARFARSARIVGLELAYDEAALVAAAAEVVAANELDEGLLRWSVFFAAEEPDLLPREAATRIAVAAQVLQDPPSLQPIRVAIFDDARKASPDALSPEAKAAAAYLGPMLARRRAIAAGADEVVLLDRDGNVAEAPIANVFAVVDGALVTPPLGYVLPGITRDAILAIARAEGIAVREAPLDVGAFTGAAEAFLTATSGPVTSIASVNGRPLGSAPGPLTTHLRQRLVAAQSGKDDRFATWLRPVRPQGWD